MATAPVSARVTDGRFILDAPEGFNRASLLGRVEIPLTNITDVERAEDPMSAVRGWRTGIGLPHLWMGTWRHDGTRDYVAVRAAMPGLVLHLVDERFARIIISVADPMSLADEIEAGRSEPQKH